MATQIHSAVSNPFFEMGHAEAEFDSSAEVEIEKILNEIGLFSDDYVMVHDKTGDLGNTFSVSDGTFPPSLGVFGLAQQQSPIVEAPKCKVETQLPAARPDLTPSQAEIKTPPSTSKQPETSCAKNRKRKSSAVSSSERSGRHQITEVERRERNRQHAKKSRLRKKSLTHVLEQSKTDLEAENQKLREQLYKSLGKQKAEDAFEARRNRAQNNFIAALKNQNNRVLSEDSMDHLKSLAAKQQKQSRSCSPSFSASSSDDGQHN